MSGNVVLSPKGRSLLYYSGGYYLICYIIRKEYGRLGFLLPVESTYLTRHVQTTET